MATAGKSKDMASPNPSVQSRHATSLRREGAPEHSDTERFPTLQPELRECLHKHPDLHNLTITNLHNTELQAWQHNPRKRSLSAQNVWDGGKMALVLNTRAHTHTQIFTASAKIKGWNWSVPLQAQIWIMLSFFLSSVFAWVIGPFSGRLFVFILMFFTFSLPVFFRWSLLTVYRTAESLLCACSCPCSCRRNMLDDTWWGDGPEAGETFLCVCGRQWGEITLIHINIKQTRRLKFWPTAAAESWSSSGHFHLPLQAVRGKQSIFKEVHMLTSQTKRWFDFWSHCEARPMWPAPGQTCSECQRLMTSRLNCDPSMSADGPSCMYPVSYSSSSSFSLWLLWHLLSSHHDSFCDLFISSDWRKSFTAELTTTFCQWHVVFKLSSAETFS